MDINLLTIRSTVAAIQERQTTATALVEDFYRKIDAEDKGKTNGYLTLSRERALAQAARIDKIADKGDPLPAFGGVPVAITSPG